MPLPRPLHPRRRLRGVDVGIALMHISVEAVTDPAKPQPFAAIGLPLFAVPVPISGTNSTSPHPPHLGPARPFHNRPYRNRRQPADSRQHLVYVAERRIANVHNIDFRGILGAGILIVARGQRTHFPQMRQQESHDKGLRNVVHGGLSHFLRGGAVPPRP